MSPELKPSLQNTNRRGAVVELSYDLSNYDFVVKEVAKFEIGKSRNLVVLVRQSMDKPVLPESSTVEGAREWLQQLASKLPAEAVDDLPTGFFDALITESITVDHLEPGRIVCSLTVPSSLLNSRHSLHGGAIAALVDILGSAAIFTTGSLTAGVSVEINVSYLDSALLGEEIEIESKTLRVGRSLAYVTVDLRKKKTGKLVAQGRHTKYLAASSRL